MPALVPLTPHTPISRPDNSAPDGNAEPLQENLELVWASWAVTRAPG